MCCEIGQLLWLVHTVEENEIVYCISYTSTHLTTILLITLCGLCNKEIIFEFRWGWPLCGRMELRKWGGVRHSFSALPAPFDRYPHGNQSIEHNTLSLWCRHSTVVFNIWEPVYGLEHQAEACHSCCGGNNTAWTAQSSVWQGPDTCSMSCS